jgi:hypothetical protein
MDMIWLNSKREKSPSLLFALCFKKVLATLLQFASENWLSSLGTPDEMDSVFISLVCKFALFVVSTAETIQQIQQLSSA